MGVNVFTPKPYAKTGIVNLIAGMFKKYVHIPLQNGTARVGPTWLRLRIRNERSHQLVSN